MTMLMGRWVGVLVTLHAVTACYNRSDGNDGSVSGLTNGTNSPGAGGTTTQGQGGTTTQGQGGTAGDAGSPGAGGAPGLAGASGNGGAAGATALCEDRCEPCAEDQVYAECGDSCVCEPADSPAKPVIEELLACDLDEPCPASVRYEDPDTTTWDNGACLLAAFRDGTRGRFHHQTTLADVGSYTTDYTFLLGGDDQVLMLRTTTSDAGSGNLERTYLPPWSCTLKSYAALDTCVAAGTATTTSGGQVLCTGTDDWFADCEPAENPECPSE